MTNLWDTIAELCLELHEDRVNVIAGGISNLTSSQGVKATRDKFGPNAQTLFTRLRDAWTANSHVSPVEVAAAFRSASAAAKIKGLQGSIELVWSGPTAGEVPVRQTEQVLCEVIEGAYTRLFMVSYVAYKVERIMRSLEAAAAREVQLDILLESSSQNGGSIDFDCIGPMQLRLPTANFYIKNPQSPAPGAVHAKCLVADGSIALISSANLTDAAMNHNMEAGILVRGGHVPAQLEEHLRGLVESKTIVDIE